jgi:hypothetical protein
MCVCVCVREYSLVCTCSCSVSVLRKDLVCLPTQTRSSACHARCCQNQHSLNRPDPFRKHKAHRASRDYEPSLQQAHSCYRSALLIMTNTELSLYIVHARLATAWRPEPLQSVVLLQFFNSVGASIRQAVAKLVFVVIERLNGGVSYV